MGTEARALTGHLVVADIWSPTSAFEASQLSASLLRHLQSKNRQAVLVTDLRGLKDIDRATLAAYSKVLVENNVWVRAAALLMETGTPDGFRMWTTIRDAQLTARSVFNKRGDLMKWANNLLDPAELEELTAYLARRETQP